jgi:hypothetical protein
VAAVSILTSVAVLDIRVSISFQPRGPWLA